MLVDRESMLSPCQPEIGMKGISLALYPHLPRNGKFVFNLIVTILRVANRFVVHLVDAHDHLLDTQSESKECMLTGLAVLGVTSFKLTNTRGDHQNGHIGLGSTGDHVLDEITVTRGINDSELEFFSLKFPQSNINGDTTLTFGLELVQHPSVFERSFTHFVCFGFELLDCTLVNTTAFIDQVTSGS